MWLQFDLMHLQDIRSYSSFSEMMEAEGLSKVLPGVETIEQGSCFLIFRYHASL